MTDKNRIEEYRRRNREEGWLVWMDPDTGMINIREGDLWGIIGAACLAPVGIICLVSVMLAL